VFDIIIQNLEKWSQEHNLIERSLKNCLVSLHDAAIEESELFPTVNASVDMISGWKLSEIKLEFENQSLIFKDGVLTYPFIITQIGLYIEEPGSFYFRGIKPIGTYKFIVTLDGKVDDTYLIINDKLIATVDRPNFI
jgi:hypothetical protein